MPIEAGSSAVAVTRPRSNFSKYLNIVRSLAVADFRLKYHDSVLGYVWTMLNPILMFGVYYFVFTDVFPSRIQNYPIFLLIGIFNYAFFQDCTFSAMNSIGNKSGLMKKIYFPRSIIVFASGGTSVLSYLINFVVLLGIIFSLEGIPRLAWLIPIPVICLLVFTMGVSFLLAALYAYFRDMGQIWGVLLLAIFWLSPIVFDVDALPPSISRYVYFNPLTRIFGLFRHYLLYNYYEFRFMGMTVVYSFLTFIIGFLVFTKNESKLPELF
ncbi:MAG TPA: ABC transporter permease [Bacteroidota bacterium]|nr:ABC transporter permease [Bacteroidota bacterium]